MTVIKIGMVHSKRVASVVIPTPSLFWNGTVKSIRDVLEKSQVNPQDIAAVGTGVYRDVESACEATITVTTRIEPSDAQHVYAACYPRYRALYPALKSEFKAWAEAS
ncbi:hypothetical protein ANRL3_00148 [Anaerolineae bacterium]|nr:hypothetical protein ANRL3_00148 [Anaerolineae bacterium]